MDFERCAIWFMSPLFGRAKESNPIHPDDEAYVRSLYSAVKKAQFNEPIGIAVDVPNTELTNETAILVMSFARSILNGYYPADLDISLARTRICWELRQQMIGSKE